MLFVERLFPVVNCAKVGKIRVQEYG